MVQMFVFDPSYIKRSKSAHRLLGHRDAGGLDRRAANRLRQGAGAGLVQLALHHHSGGGIACPSLIGFLVRELMADHPVVNLRVFKLRSYSTGVFLMTVLGFVLYGSIVIMPIWLQTLLGYPAMATGFAMAPRGLGLDDRHAADRDDRGALRPAQDSGRRACCWARFRPGNWPA